MASSGNNGRLLLVGLGPGDRRHVTPAAVDALACCDVVVGYRGYVDQVSDLLHGKEVVAMELGQEVERASKAVELASAGHTVAVISSGDVGVYGMGGVVFEVLAKQERADELQEIEVVPGVSAMQAAAALLGAPLMQDFCAISLSDLLVPWVSIQRRLQAAAQGDFVVVLYNPRSRKRRWHLPEAQRMLLQHRTEGTPVGIVRNAYRSGQQVILTDLGSLEQHLDAIDMFTTIVIGNSTSFVDGGRIITPRGYGSSVTRRAAENGG